MYRDERRGRGFRGRRYWGGGRKRYFHNDSNPDEIPENRYEGFDRRQRGNRGRDRQDREGGRVDGEKSGSSDRPPPGLKGRQIGLWYSRRSKANAAQREKNMVRKMS